MDDPRNKRTQAQVIQAIKGSRGIKIDIARRLDVNRMTIRRYLRIYPEALAAYNQECEVVLDRAESKLYEKAIEEGSEQSLHFLLERKGRQRGYARRQELVGDQAAPLDIVVQIGQDQNQPRLQDQLQLQPKQDPKDPIE